MRSTYPAPLLTSSRDRCNQRSHGTCTHACSQGYVASKDHRWGSRKSNTKGKARSGVAGDGKAVTAYNEFTLKSVTMSNGKHTSLAEGVSERARSDNRSSSESSKSSESLEVHSAL